MCVQVQAGSKDFTAARQKRLAAQKSGAQGPASQLLWPAQRLTSAWFACLLACAAPLHPAHPRAPAPPRSAQSSGRAPTAARQGQGSAKIDLSLLLCLQLVMLQSLLAHHRNTSSIKVSTLTVRKQHPQKDPPAPREACRL